MKLIKTQGTGNDFIIVDLMQYEIGVRLSKSEIAIKLCDRKNGIGADGILFVEPSLKARAKMTIINADGTEAMMCGNGLRCFARYVMDKNHVNDIYVETVKAVYHVKCDLNFDANLNGYQILLNNVFTYDDSDAIQAFSKHFDDGLNFEFVTVSNPHAVTFVTDTIADDKLLTRYGNLANLEKSYFEDGCNVNFTTILAEKKLYVRTFERGVGITKSCGTGMTSCATSYAKKYGFFDEWIEIYNDGGMIKCKVLAVADHYEVYFVGNATNEFEVTVDLNELMNVDEIKLNPIYYDIEKEQFSLFFNQTRECLNHYL